MQQIDTTEVTVQQATPILDREEGQTMAEYALILTGVALVVMALATNVRGQSLEVRGRVVRPDDGRERAVPRVMVTLHRIGATAGPSADIASEPSTTLAANVAARRVGYLLLIFIPDPPPNMVGVKTCRSITAKPSAKLAVSSPISSALAVDAPMTQLKKQMNEVGVWSASNPSPSSHHTSLSSLRLL